MIWWNRRKSGILLSLVIIAMFLVGCSTAATTSSSSSSNTSTQVDAIQPATVRGKVLIDNGEMVMAGVVVEDEYGNKSCAFTNALSGYNLKLKPGSYTLTFTRGFEYSTVTKQITVESYKTYYIQDVRLVQLEDSYSLGWVAGDLHQHTYYSDGINSVIDLAVSNISNGLYYGFLSDHNSGLGLSEWAQANRMEAYLDGDGNSRMFDALDAVEVTTEYGHYQSLGVGLTFDTYEVTLRESERYLPADQKRAIILERVAYIADTIIRSGGVAQINHAFSSSTMGFSYWEVADHFDSLEIWNGVFNPGDGRYESTDTSGQSQNYRSKLKWFELLNDIKNGGKYLPGTGGSDNHDIAGTYSGASDIGEINNIDEYNALYQQSGRYSGVPSTYLKIDGDVNQTSILAAIREGHCFVTNGPLIYATMNGASYGETVAAVNGQASISLKGFARDGVEGIRIVKNGETIQTITNITTAKFNQTITLSGLQSQDWIVFEVLGNDTQYAITNPIFVA